MTARNFLYAWMPAMAVILTATALWLAHEVQEPASVSPPGSAEVAVDAPEQTSEVAETNPSEPTIPFFLTICFIMTLGALGAHIQAIISFADYIGNQKFKESWTFFYVKRPFVGATISLLTFAVLRGGLVDSGTTKAASQGIWGTVAIGLMAGLFSRQAMDKIAEVFGVVFSGKKVQRDDSLDKSAALQTPELMSAEPPALERGVDTPVTITGAHFHKTTEVRIGEQKLVSELVSETEIKVSVPKAMTKKADLEAVDLIATNPKASSPDSEPLTLPIIA